MCFLRHLDEDSCFGVLKEACNHKDKIIGVGLDSSEKGNPPTKFKKLFEEKKILYVDRCTEKISEIILFVPDSLLSLRSWDFEINIYIPKFKILEG